MKSIKIIAFCLLALPFLSCTTETVDAIDNATSKVVTFKPNQCDEAWDLEKYTNQTKLTKREDRFKAFLGDNGVKTLTNFKNTQDDKIYCAACFCPSNDNYSFEISVADFTKLKTLDRFKTLN
jgi:hypothetical protein